MKIRHTAFLSQVFLSWPEYIPMSVCRSIVWHSFPSRLNFHSLGRLWLLTFFFLSRSNIPSFLVDDVSVSCFCKAVSMCLLSFQSLPSFPSSLGCHFAIRFFPTTVYVSFYDHHLALLHLPGILPLLPDFFCQYFSPLLRYPLLSIMLFSSQVVVLLLPW